MNKSNVESITTWNLTQNEYLTPNGWCLKSVILFL
ncbi:DUF2649 family protein [Spiroplasma poulsonii]|nr:DUF2649 family protein [Spiroplasma poulsonii]UNF62678.1 DUF2649 domain-containing protein [Spiroplasma poulsonii]